MSDGFRVVLGGRLDQRVALALDGGDLRADKVEPIHLPSDRRLQMARQRPAVSGLELVEMAETIAMQRVVIDDALTGEQAADPVRVPDALLEQRAALATETAAILL